MFIEFGIPMKLIRLVKMCLNETYSRVQVGKHLPDTFPIKYYSGDQIKKNEVGGACSRCGGGERCIQDFGGET
jgi:hypothetical protein